MQVWLGSCLIREAIKKKCPPSLLLFFKFMKFHLKSKDLSLFLEGGWVSRKDHLVTLLRCHYWLGGGGSKASVTMSLYITFVCFLTASLTITRTLTLISLRREAFKTNFFSTNNFFFKNIFQQKLFSTKIFFH